MIVMMICHYDDTNSSGGLESQARLLSRTMRAQDRDVIMLASTRNWSRAGWEDDRGVRVRYFWTFGSPQISGRHLPAALFWAAQLLVWVAWHRRTIGLLHCHQIRIHAFVAALASKFFRTPSLVKSATGGSGADIKTIGSRKYFGSPGRRFIARNIQRFVATTKSIKEDLLIYGVPESKIEVIPNGLVLGPIDEREPDPSRANKALFLGRLASDKNVVALAAAAIEASARSGLQVDFWGRGAAQVELEHLLAQAGQPPRVRYCGFTSDPQSILERYGYLLLASDAEGLSNAMLEAMAHGVVPITTKVSGCIDHVVPGQTGFFFDGIDAASLLQGLEQLSAVSSDEWLRLSQRVRRYAYERFDIHQVIDAYLKVYASLMDKKENKG